MNSDLKDITETEQVRVLGKSVSREIVQEIMNFGVSQQQIIDVIVLVHVEIKISR